MRERATVVKAAGKIATVRIVKNPQCESCRACAFKNGKSTVNVKAKNEIGAAVGDSVTVACEKDNRTLASFLVYIVPVLFAGTGRFDRVFRLRKGSIYRSALSGNAGCGFCRGRDFRQDFIKKQGLRYGSR